MKWLTRASFSGTPSGQSEVVVGYALDEALRAAIDRSHLLIVRWICEQPSLSPEASAIALCARMEAGIKVAAAKPDFVMLEWFCRQNAGLVESALRTALTSAISTSNVEVVQWLMGETLRGGGALTRWQLSPPIRNRLIRLAERERAWCTRQ